MAAELYRILEILSIAILILSLLRCLFNHERGVMYVDAYGKLKNPIDLPILIEFYYDAFDGVGEDFIAQQLIPTYDKLENVTDIMLVPCGKTQILPVSNGSKELQCLPNPAHCKANLEHVCTMDTIKDNHLKLQLIGCLMRNLDTTLHPSSDGFVKCSQEHHLPKVEIIQQCVEGTKGLVLLKRYGEMTAEAIKGLFQEPFVILNGSTPLEVQNVDNLFGNICKLEGKNASVALKNICENI